MDKDRTRERLVEFLGSVARAGSHVEDADDGTNLIRAGVMDSFAVIQIISYLEQNHDVDLIESGIDPTELATIGGMLAAIGNASG